MISAKLVCEPFPVDVPCPIVRLKSPKVSVDVLWVSCHSIVPVAEPLKTLALMLIDWFINSKKKEKNKDEKFSLLSLLRLFFYFAAGCYFAWVILFLELEVIK